jgi:glycosyltransferase involved in cell wall biosynthesis
MALSRPSVLVVTERGDRPETGTFIALHRAGVRIKVLGWADSPYAAWLRDADVPFEPLVLLGKRDPSGTESIRWHIDDFRPDILHLMRKRAIFNGLAAAKGRPVKIVLYRGIVGNVSMLNPLDWISFLNPRVDRIVCVAEAVRRSFLQLGFGPFRIPREKLVTIHKGHDLDWYRQEPLDLTTVGVPRGAFVVACVANVRPRKGIPVLVRASEHLPAGLPIHFILVGTGMTSPSITRLIRRSPYRDRFHVLGYRNDATQILAASDVSVLPSLRREGLPRSVIESMAYRVPAIVSDAGGSPELVEHERSGLVVRAGDPEELGAAILRLYVDRELCAELGVNARRRIATTFTVEKTAAETLKVYEDLVNASGPSNA